MDFFKSAWSWFSGSSITASLAKTALLGYVSRLLSNSTNPGTSPEAAPDKGVRLQLNPSTDNQIPVLYGSAYFGGNITDAALSSDYKKMTYCLTLAEVTGEKLSTGQQTAYTFNNVYFNNNRVVFKADGVTVDYTLDASGNQDISFRDLAKVYFYKGTTPIQPTGYSGTTPASHTVMPGWTAGTHPMTGLLYAIVEINYNRDKNVTGLPDCQFHITSNMTLAGDVLVDYMLSSRYGGNIDVSEIDTSFASLNTFCSTGFTYTNLSGQSTNSPITINGLVDTNKTILDNMEEMAKAASSWITYDIHSGKWTVIINKAGSSIATFTDSNIIGEISISGTSLTQLSNAADVKYQNTDILDKTDFVKIEIPEIDLYQNEPRSTIQISLPYTNKQVVAAKVGLQALKQARIDKIISFKADYSYINLRAGDIIDVTNSIYGYTNKVFRIINVTEVENESGSLEVEIKALEYDADVYAYTIQQYNVTTDAGILGIGSIGKPNTPSVIKTEEANVPKIQINGVVPSGIVDSIEYWITFDVGIGNDSARTYIQIGRYQNTNGTILTEDDLVSYTYSGLGQGDFYVKIRGVNNVTTGPFSDPSGLVQYRPVVVADTISDTPVSIGGQLMGLGLLTLLNNLDKLFGGDTSVGGLFDKVFSLFKDETGVDLVGQAAGGELVVASDLEIKADGSSLGTTTAAIDFIGPLEASGSSSIEVKIKDGTKNKDILAWNKDEGKWETISDCIDCDFTNTPPPDGPEEDCKLSVAATLPANNFQGATGVCPSTTTVPFSGSYFIKFNITPGRYGAKPALASTIGAGNQYTIAKAGNTDFTWWGAPDNTVGTKWIAKSTASVFPSGKQASEITVGKRYKIKAVGSTVWKDIGWEGATTNSTPAIGDEFTATAVGSGTGTVDKADGTGWVYGLGVLKPSIPLVAPLSKGTGSFKLYGTDGNLEQTLPISSAIVHNNVLELPFSNRAPGKDYYIIWDEGIVTNCSCENPIVDDADTWTFTTSPSPQTGYTLSAISPTGIADDANPSDYSDRSKIDYTYSPTSAICSSSQHMILTFGMKVKKGNGSITIKDRESGSTVATLSVGSATITEVSGSWKVDFGAIPALDVGKYYDVSAPVGLLTTDPQATSTTVCDKTTNTPADAERQSRAKTWGFKTDEALKVTSFEVCLEASGKAKQRTNIIVHFNKAIRVKTGVAEVTIKGSGLFGGTFQKIDLNGTYANKKYGDISNEGGTSLTINPTQQMKGNSGYYLNIPAGVIIDDECDAPWEGISDSTTVAWETDGAAPTPPEKLTLGSIFFDFNFERPVVPGQGKLNIIAVNDGRLLAQVGANDVAMKIKNNTPF